MGQNTSTAVLEAVNTMTGGAFPMKDPLDAAGSCVFDDKVMAEKLPAAILKRFQDCLISGDPTTEEDQKIIADTLYEWARERGAIDFAHWCFPLRGGGGAVGGMLGAFKQDTLLDLDFASKYVTKPMKACLPAERLFQGETDGSSFPNGGLRVTHSAAAFTTWDRTSAPFVLNKTLYIPCAFVTHFGKCIDEKTPLLRSMDAVKVQGLRLLKAVGLGKDANTMHSYLGWEQEFFVIDAEHYKARPDLVNTGRSLFGKLPTRHQQGDLNYFQPIPTSVATLLDRVQALMLEVGCPMAVKHNEVAPGQHEMSPVFRTANVSCDTNVLFMEVMNREAQKLGLQVLFHEKPFAGINGSGKHANWSVGTDTGLNFFYPGKTEEGAKLFVTGIACLSYGLAQYNELVRCTVATAGNDHRLGAQEAPPAIISQKFVRTNQFTTPSLNSSQSKTFHRNLWMSQVHVPCTVPSVQSPWQDQSLQIKNDLDRGAVSIEMRAILASLCILQIAALEYTPEALKDEIHDLPGLPADVNFKMFSGYIDLTPLGQRPKSKEIFYWFVEAQKDPDNAPLVFWTNGGPGCSGLAGFLTEMGPFKVGFDGKNLVHNPYAWNKIANMIFVEQPAGVGFSPAGENPKYSDENSANDNRHFIMKFYDRYPALKTHDFYLSSESYGGHYLPTLGKVLVEQGGVPSFKGIMVGNPLTYMPYRDHGFYGTCWGHQLLPKPLWDAYVEHDCAKLKNPSAQTPDECWSVTNAMHRILSGLDPYVLDFPTCVGGGAATGQHERLAILKTIARATKQPEQKYQPCSEDLTTHYLNLKEVKAAIHARDFTWQLCSGEVNYLYNPHDTHAPMMPLWKFLIEHASLNLMIFSGDDDSICATLGSQQFIWDLGYETDEAKNWAPWKVDDEIAGYWTEFKVPAGGKFAFVTVHGAGHMVPSTQPKSGLATFEKFLKRTVGKTTLATM